MVILAVPDDQLAAVARGAVATNSRPEERVWLHLSGASGYEALGPTAGPRGLCHPLQSLRGDAGDREALLGAFFAIDGEGNVAPQREAPPLPDGATGWPSRRINVA